jgi:hypothetical protein
MSECLVIMGKEHLPKRRCYVDDAVKIESRRRWLHLGACPDG